jgi:hypothetical protein
MSKAPSNWIARLFRRNRASISHSNGELPTLRQRRRLALETLEDRLAPSVSFGAAIGGDASGHDTRGGSQGTATATDSAGNVYVTGNFSGNAYFGGNTTLTSEGEQDAFVAKYTQNSGSLTLDWVEQFGGSGATVAGQGVAIDSSGNVWTTGYFSGGAVSFDGGSAQNSNDHDSGNSAYLSELSSSGSYKAVTLLGQDPIPFIGQSSSDGYSSQGLGITTSGTNVYVAGDFESSEFDYGNSIFGSASLSSSGGGGTQNGFVYVQSGSGDFAYNIAWGAINSSTQCNAIAVDSSGDIYTTGSFNGTASFDPTSSSNHTLTSPSYYNSSSDSTTWQTAGFLSILSPSGAYVDATDFGLDPMASGDSNVSSFISQGSGIAVGGGNAYVAGWWQGASATFGSSHLTSSDGGTNETAFVYVLHSNGTTSAYSLAYGSNNISSQGNAIVVDSSDNIYTTGWFQGAGANFDPNSTNHQQNSASGGSDYSAFVSKLSSSGQFGFSATLGDLGAGKSPSTAWQFSGIALASNASVYVAGQFLGNNVNFNPFGATSLSSAKNGTDPSFFLTQLTQSGTGGSTTHPSIYAPAAYEYAYQAYLDAFYAYAYGYGSYGNFVYAYYADLDSQIGNQWEQAGNASEANLYFGASAYYSEQTYYGSFNDWFVSTGCATYNYAYYSYVDSFYAWFYALYVTEGY